MGTGTGNPTGITPEQVNQAFQNPAPPPQAVMPCQKHRIVFKFIRETTNVEIPAVQASVEQQQGSRVDMPASDAKGISKVVVAETRPFRVVEAEADLLYEVVSVAEQAIPENT